MFQFHVHDQSEIPFAHMVGLAASLSHHTHFAIKSKEVSIEVHDSYASCCFETFQATIENFC